MMHTMRTAKICILKLHFLGGQVHLLVELEQGAVDKVGVVLINITVVVHVYFQDIEVPISLVLLWARTRLSR